MLKNLRRPVQSVLPALLLLLAVGCDKNVNIKNTSTRAASVYVSVPETSGKALVRVDPGAEESSELGDSGIYTVYVVADDVVTGALKKTRDDLEAQLQAATSPTDIQDLTAKIQALSKFTDQLNARATSCAGKMANGDDATVRIGWDDSKQAFTASCSSAAAETQPSGDQNGNPADSGGGDNGGGDNGNPPDNGGGGQDTNP